jgi:hypothetical protein
MPKPISILNLFPTYASREAYKAATGKEAPPWNPGLHPKAWEDPAALSATEDMVVYDLIFVKFDANQKPVFKKLFLSPAEAANVNIAPKGTGMTNVSGADAPEVLCPLRPLEDHEVLKPTFGDVPNVFEAIELVSVDTGFTMADREKLIAIAGKLGA